MYKTAKIIGPISIALIAGALFAAPASAQNVKSGGTVGGTMGRASGAPSVAAPSTAAPSAKFSSGTTTGVAPSSGRIRSGTVNSNNFAVNSGSNSGSWSHHRHHHHGGGVGFGFGFYGGPYAYDDPYYYGDSYYADEDDGCYVRRVHRHHRWVLQRYCS